MKINNLATHEVEVNFFYLHYHDARKLGEWAKQEPSKLKSLYTRHAILAVIFAAEALINRILSAAELPKELAGTIDKLQIRKKWAIAPFLLTGD